VRRVAGLLHTSTAGNRIALSPTHVRQSGIEMHRRFFQAIEALYSSSLSFFSEAIPLLEDGGLYFERF
jgi:hypothetical protein